MAGRDKLTPALLSHTFQSGKSVVTLSLPRLYIALAALMAAFTLGNLTIACSTQFQCGKFLPTPGYLGCFRGHDRIFIMSCTYYALVLPMLFIGVVAQVRTSASGWERAALIGTSLAVTVMMPLCAMTDEVTSTHLLPFEAIYTVSGYLLSLSALLWLLLAYHCLSRDQAVFTIRERTWYRALQLLVLFVLVLAAIVLINVVRSKPIVSDLVESLCEWALALAGIATPVVVGQLVRGLHLSFSTLAVGNSDKELRPMDS